MKPFVLAACLAAVLVAIGSPRARPRVITIAPHAGAEPRNRASSGPSDAPCPRGSLPDDGVCVPVPAAGDDVGGSGGGSSQGTSL